MVLVNDSVTVAVMTEPRITPINIQHIPSVLPTTLRGVTSPYLDGERNTVESLYSEHAL